MEKFKYLKREGISKLPKSPGVYAFKNGREFLYIGKAANIKERVENHFQQPAYRDGLFIEQVKKIGFIKTDSEIEALILEANLIKKYQPKYNVVWRDDKNYFFVAVTKEEFPRVFITHQPRRAVGGWRPRIFWTHQTKVKKILAQKQKIGVNFTGPFVEGTALKQTLKILRKVFPYRSCKTLPKRPCLWYQLDRCPAPCLLKTKLGQQIPLALSRIKNESQRNAKNLLKILEKGKIRVLKDLKKEMKKASVGQDFEKAAKIRDQIGALERILAHARIFEELTVPQTSLWYWKKVEEELKNLFKIKKRVSSIEAYDISNIQGQEATGSMVTFVDGLPDKNFYRKFRIRISGKPNDVAMIKETLSRRLGHPEWPYPDLILIDGGRAQLNAAHQCLTWNVKHIKVMALAKKKNELFVENQKKPILLKNLSREIFNLILQLRDEAHRFAITYHKKLREIDLRESI